MNNLLSNPITTSMETITDVLTTCYYIEGNPREFRANAKDGVFKVDGTETVATSARLHILSYRVFEGVLFTKPNVWLELFFVDELGNVSNMLFNSYSVKNFQQYQSKLFYRRVSLCQVITEISWTAKTVVLSGGDKVNYHIAEFTVGEVLAEEISDVVAEFNSVKSIYREATAVEAQGSEADYKLLAYENYPSVRQKAIPAPSQAEEETDRVDPVPIETTEQKKAPVAANEQPAENQVDALPY